MQKYINIEPNTHHQKNERLKINLIPLVITEFNKLLSFIKYFLKIMKHI